MERRKGSQRSLTNRELAKREEQKRIAKRRQMSRRLFVLGGAATGLSLLGYLGKDAILNKDNEYSEDELKQAASLAIGDYEDVLEQHLDRDTILANTGFKDTGSMVNVGAAQEEALSIASTTADFQPRIEISREYITALPQEEREGVVRALMIHELWHYASPRENDADISQRLFDKVPSLQQLQLKPLFTKGFRIAGTSGIDGKEYGWFKSLEEGSAFAAGNFIVQKKGVLPPTHPLFSRFAFQQETALFDRLLTAAYPDKGEALKKIAEIRTQPYPLRNFATRIGTNNLGLSGENALDVGLAVLSYINSGNSDAFNNVVG